MVFIRLFYFISTVKSNENILMQKVKYIRGYLDPIRPCSVKMWGHINLPTLMYKTYHEFRSENVMLHQTHLLQTHLLHTLLQARKRRSAV